MFYNTYGATDTAGTQPYAPININASSTVNLASSMTGDYAGILFFEDRTATTPGGWNDTYGGGSAAVYTGVIYAPNANITMFGNASQDNAFTLLVASTIHMVGTSNFMNNYSALPNGSPIQTLAFVE
jgi:hypothetical protein